MKKIVALLMALVLCLGLFAGCVNETPNETTGKAPTAEDAKTYIVAMYKGSSELVMRDFDRIAVVLIDGIKFNVTWTADKGEDLVKITSTDTMATIDINEKPAEDFSFVLTATVKAADGTTATATFTHSVKAPVTTGTVFVEEFEAGKTYKFALKQNKIDGQPVLYFNGQKSGNYLATTTNPLEAVDVTVEAAEGGYYLTFMDGETKKYINITTYLKDGAEKNTQDIGTEPTCVYTWDAERLTFTAKIGELGTFYLGTYNTYNTISSSNVSYIEDLGKIGTEQFPAGLCTINAAAVETPETGKAYVWGLKQNKIEGQPTLYFTGEKSGNYLATSANLADAIRVYVEETEGGYHLFFYKAGVKTYINITTYLKDGAEKNTQDIGTEPTCVYTWDAERLTFTAKIGELGTFYLGTYNTYNTISSSNVSYIEDLGKIGTEQFPASLYDLGLPVEEPGEGGEDEPVTAPTDPAVILKDAFALAEGKSLAYTATLTGVVKSIDTAYSAEYKNITVTIEVAEKQLQCYRLKGDGADKLAVGDKITVTGEITNYKGNVQFNAGATFIPAK